MSELVYDGAHDAVFVVDLDAIVIRGTTVTAPDDVAARLLEQPDNWKLATLAKSSAKAEKE